MASGRGDDSRRVRSARFWHTATAAFALVAVVIQFALAIPPVDSVNSTWSAGDVTTRLLRFFSYFTIQTNILVIVVSIALARNPARDSSLWRVGRLASLFGVTVTFVVYGALLSSGLDFSGATGVTNMVLHYVVPVLTVGGWLLFGPRPRIDARTLLLSALWPIGYMAYTLAHGYLTGWYPYPFINVNRLGYPEVLLRSVGIVALMVTVGTGFLVADRVLPATKITDRFRSGNIL